jgi:hypothetical protein
MSSRSRWQPASCRRARASRIAPHSGRHIDLNRAGGLHAFADNETWTRLETSWWDLAIGVTTLDDVVAELERHARLPAPTAETSRATDMADLVVQTVAVTTARLDPTMDWTWRNGMLDTPGPSSGSYHDEWFAQFTSAAAAVRYPMTGDLLDQPAYCFWFLLRSGEPVLCLETIGTIHKPDGTPTDLSSVEHGRVIVEDMLATIS